MKPAEACKLLSFHGEDFEVIITSDGSPSLRPASSHKIESNEMMHSVHGAAEESLYIYGAPVAEVLKITEPDSSIDIQIVGLGVGYIEMCIAAQLVRAYGNDIPAGIHLTSYENSKALLKSFEQWLEQGAKTLPCLKEEIDSIGSLRNFACQMIAEKTETKPLELKNTLGKFYENNRLHLRESLSDKSKQMQRNSNHKVVLFDAYSAKTSPELWTTEVFQPLVQSENSDSALFCTYACNRNIKSLLTSLGFDLKKRDGFAAKRHSTLATKGKILGRIFSS